MVDAGLDNPNGRAACREQHAKTVASNAFQAIDACLRADCQADCYGDTGFFSAYSQECQLCTEQSCGDVPSRCVADAHCEALAVQAYESGPAGHNPATITALTAAVDEVGENERKMGYCPIEHCPLECGFDGNNLGCVSAYQWPRSLPATARAELQLVVFNPDDWSNVPLPGAVVDVCRPASADCVPVDTFEADANGLAKGVVQLDFNAGFRGFFRVRAGTTDNKETLPMNVFAFPLTRDTRALAPTFRADDVELAIDVLAGGRIPGRAQLAVQFLDCSARQAEAVTLRVPPSVMEDGAKLVPLEDGLFAIYNAKPGCFDVSGYDPMGNETHRMRLLALPDVGTWAYVFPTSDAPALGYTCTPLPE